MGKRSISRKGSKVRDDYDAAVSHPEADRPSPKSVEPIEAKTPAQKRYITAI
jgi:hypothetical protein